MAHEFVLVRLTRITGVDLRVFDFDYDLTWMAFLMNADEHIYGRYGGRDAGSADRRLSLAGLHYAMQAALEAHRQRSPSKAPEKKGPRLLAEEYSAARRQHLRGECIHCHMIYDFRREELRQAGHWNREQLWIYPLPENVGLTLDVDRGNQVWSVTSDSPAAKAGVRAGDLLRRLNNFSVASFADAQYALQHAPPKGSIPIEWKRDGKAMNGTLELADGWRKTNPTWRTSLLDLLPSLSVYGDNLSAADKKALGLEPKRLAFRQEKPVQKEARAAGVREGDVIIGIDNEFPDMSMLEFLGHVRKTYMVGDRVTLHVLRDGKRIDLPLTLR